MNHLNKLTSRLPRWCQWKSFCLPQQETHRHGFDLWVRNIPWCKKWHPILTWKIPQIEEPGRLRCMGCKVLDMTEYVSTSRLSLAGVGNLALLFFHMLCGVEQNKKSSCLYSNFYIALATLGLEDHFLFVRFKESNRLLENINDDDVESFPFGKMKGKFSACGQCRQSKTNISLTDLYSPTTYCPSIAHPSLFATPSTAAHGVSLFFTISRSFSNSCPLSW